jgi:hypothetical protein
MKVNRKDFFNKNNIEYNKENLLKYNNGWSFSEIRKGEQFIEKEYKENFDLYFNLQKENFN